MARSCIKSKSLECIQTQQLNWGLRLYLQHFEFLTYEWTHYASVIVTKLERFAWDKSLRIIGPILLSCEENEVL
jgi:hypothetical protein